MLPPVQPKPLKTCSSAILAPGAMSGLVRVIVWAAAASAPKKAARSASAVSLSMSPPFQVDASGGPPSTTRGENAVDLLCVQPLVSGIALTPPQFPPIKHATPRLY